MFILHDNKCFFFAFQSSFLQVLLKELPVSRGSLNVKGRVSYASQDAWLFPATVRENVLFGLPYDSTKYKEVIKMLTYPICVK